MLKLTFTLVTTANCAGLVQDSKGVSKLKTNEYWFQDRTKKAVSTTITVSIIPLVRAAIQEISYLFSASGSALHSAVPTRLETKKKKKIYSPHLNRVFLSKKVARMTDRNYQNALSIFLLHESCILLSYY